MTQQHNQQSQPVQNEQQGQPAQSKHLSGQTGVVRILSLALLGALVAIVALSFALCARQGADDQIQASQASSVQAEESSQSASVSALPAVADSAWDEETDDEASIDEDGGNEAPIDKNRNDGSSIDENESYTSKDEVALYIHTYGHLPSNYISKTKARNAGWVAKEGNLDDVLPGMSIGGSEFYNNEGRLPDAAGRTWTECDINYEGGYRGAERIVFSNDGLIFYTADHYETFEQLY